MPRVDKDPGGYTGGLVRYGPPPAKQQQPGGDWEKYYGSVRKSYEPDIKQIDIQNAEYGQQLGFVPQQYGYDRQNLLDQLAQSKQGYRGQQQIYGIQGAALGRQRGLLSAQEKLAQQLFGIQGAELGQTVGETKKQYGEDVSGFAGSQAAAGALGAKSFRQGLSDLKRHFDQRLATLGREKTKLGINMKQDRLSYEESQNANRDGAKELAVHAHLLGVDQHFLEQSLSRGLEKLGISQILDVDHLKRLLGSGDIEKLRIGSRIMQDALAASQANAEQQNAQTFR